MTNEIISLSNNQPYLLESQNNKGKLYLFTSSTDEKSSSFMSHALLVPTILRIVERSQVQNPISYTLGKQDVVKTRINNKIENVAYMQVKDMTNKNNDKIFIFNGWTFSSDPNLTPFDHAIYDLQLVNCNNV